MQRRVIAGALLGIYALLVTLVEVPSVAVRRSGAYLSYPVSLILSMDIAGAMRSNAETVMWLSFMRHMDSIFSAAAESQWSLFRRCKSGASPQGCGEDLK